MTDRSREHEYWAPEPIFAGKTVFCLASGPSLTADVCYKIKGRPAIVVNSSCMAAPWADMLFFTDCSWYELRREIVATWPGLVVTMCKTAKNELPDRVKRIQTVGDPDLPCEFPPVGSAVVRQGRSSGHTAISLAIACGASRIVLAGYDCRLVGGREHHHGEYLVDGRTQYETEREDPRWNNKREYSTVFAPAYAGWKTAADRRGVEILNATPGSAITEFPFVDLDKILAA